MTSRKTDWVLSAETFERLLAHFGDERETAATAYELARQKLVRLFRYRGCRSSSELADEVFNRVAHRIERGEQIARDQIGNYLFGVARNVLREYHRRPDGAAVGLDDIAPSAQPIDDPSARADEIEERRIADNRLECLEECLSKEPLETRAMVVEYYEGQEAAKIRNRREMADGLGTTLNSLRIRMHRVRVRLERCVTECLERERGAARRPADR